MGLVMADTDRAENAQYYNCRTDESDELENAQWYGINTYVQCDDISDPDKATGFNLLRDSFKSYDYSIPVVLSEFGCVSPAFPTVDGFEAQRTFHDAEFMNMAQYSDYFAGGFAFEYSTENANSMATSAYPFTTFGPQNYGLGYLSPEDCTDAGTNCTYERFPNFAFLAEAYAAYDGSNEPTLDSYVVPANHAKTSTCPSGSPDPRNFQWEGDSVSSEACPSSTDGRFQCSVATPAVSFASTAPQLVTTVFVANVEAAATTTVPPTPSAANELTLAPSTATTEIPIATPQTPAISTSNHGGCRIR
ncbi:hypothetical protein KRP22_006030 [Phytophthora ramorum]|nr:1,3-beta-glucanosyltransferase GAS5 [Phytophthora ramorum]